MARKSKQTQLCRRISPRDLEIYRLCEVENKTQSLVAKLHQISQPRVCAIVKRTYATMGEEAPEGLDELSREKQLRAVARRHRMKLDYAYDQSMVAWEKSLESQHRVKLKYVEGVKDPVPHELIVTTKHGDQKHLDAAVRYAKMEAQFEGFNDFGEVNISLNGRVPEVLHKSEIERRRELKQKVFAGEFDTPGDVGAPESHLNKVGATRRENGEAYTAPAPPEPDYWDRWYAKCDEEMKKKSLTKTPSEALLSKDDVEFSYDLATKQVMTPKNKNNVLYSGDATVTADVSRASSQVVCEESQTAAAPGAAEMPLAAVALAATAMLVGSRVAQGSAAGPNAHLTQVAPTNAVEARVAELLGPDFVKTLSFPVELGNPPRAIHPQRPKLPEPFDDFPRSEEEARRRGLMNWVVEGPTEEERRRKCLPRAEREALEAREAEERRAGLRPYVLPAKYRDEMFDP